MMDSGIALLATTTTETAETGATIAATSTATAAAMYCIHADMVMPCLFRSRQSVMGQLGVTVL